LILKEKGRYPDEDGFILMENGSYRGYGFIPSDHHVLSKEDIKAFLIPQKNTLEAQRIVENAILRFGKQIPIA